MSHPEQTSQCCVRHSPSLPSTVGWASLPVVPRDVLYYYSDLENRKYLPVAGKVLLFPHPPLPCQVLGGSCYKLVLENHVVTKYNQEESQGLIIPKPPRYNTQVTRAPKTHTRRHKTILSSFSIIPRVLNRNCSGGWAQSCKK